jgi:hypothetical protein
MFGKLRSDFWPLAIDWRWSWQDFKSQWSIVNSQQPKVNSQQSTFMKIYLSILLCTLFFSCSKSNPGTAAGPLENRILAVLNHPNTRYFYTTDHVSPEIIQKTAELEGYTVAAKFSIANRGNDFQLGCCSWFDKKPLAFHRLVFSATLGEREVFCYESGGIGHRLSLSYAEKTTDHNDYYNGNVAGVNDFTSLEEIKQALAAGQFERRE